MKMTALWHQDNDEIFRDCPQICKYQDIGAHRRVIVQGQLTAV
jgi:hypothetical protein